jgi:hypothetical protein
MSIWGNSNANNKKPTWTHLTVAGRGKTPPLAANTYATSRGWVTRRPYGEEVIATVAGLDQSLGNSAVKLLWQHPALANVTNAAAQTLSVLVSFNKPVLFLGGTPPTLLAISSQLSPANVTLTYDSTVSDANSGKLVFRNTNVGLAQANAVGCTWTVNSTSTATGWANIADPAIANNAVANGVPAGLTLTISCS